MGRLRNPDPALRFNERIIKDESGCWLWQGKLNVNGYAVFKINARAVHVHRWAYETYKEPIPKGMIVDHRCEHRSCVNPDHLEAVTTKVNNARARTRCFQAGHPLIEGNIYFTSRGTRICRLCDEERKRKYRNHSDQFRKAKQELEPTPASIVIVVASDASDNDPLMQELEQLKQKGLILTFFTEPRKEGNLYATS